MDLLTILIAHSSITNHQSIPQFAVLNHKFRRPLPCQAKLPNSVLPGQLLVSRHLVEVIDRCQVADVGRERDPLHPAQGLEELAMLRVFLRQRVLKNVSAHVVHDRQLEYPHPQNTDSLAHQSAHYNHLALTESKRRTASSV